MNVKKFVKKIATVGAVSGLMVGTTLMGAFAASTQADLGDLPAPFVENGVADFQIVLGQGAAVQDVLGAIDISNSFQASAVTEEVVEIPGQTETVVEGGAGLEGATGDYLVLNEATAAQPNLDEDDLPAILGEETLTDEDGEDSDGGDLDHDASDYEQEINIGDLKVQFGELGDLDNPIVGIEPSGETYRVVVEFDDAMDLTALDDNEQLTIAGKTFTVGTDTDEDTLVLFGSDTTTFLELGQPQTLTVDDESIELEIVGGNSDGDDGSGSIVLSVNGARQTMTEGQTKTVSGVDIYVKDVFVTNIPTLDASASIFVGSEEYTLEDDSAIEINGDDFDGYNFELTGENMTAVEQMDFVFSMDGLDEDWGFDEDNLFIEEGETFVDPIFDTFEVVFAGASLEQMDEDKTYFSLEASGNVVEMTFTNEDGDEVSFDAFETDGLDDGDNATYYADEGDDFIVGEATLVEDNYFLCNDDSNKKLTTLYMVDDIDFDELEVTIENLMDGTSKVYDETETIDDCQLDIDDILDGSITLSSNTADVIYLKGQSSLDLSAEGPVVFREYVDDAEEVDTGENITVAITADSDEDAEMAVTGVTTIVNDDDNEEFLSAFGTYFTMDEDGLDFELWTPDEDEVEYNVFIAPTDAQTVTTGGGSSLTTQSVNPVAVGAAVLDVDVSLATATKNLVVVGGPCINSIAAELMGNPAECAEEFEPGKAIVELFDLDNGKVAMLVAGYEALETQAAARAVATNKAGLVGDAVAVQVTTLNDYTISNKE
ncbi:MAG: S-layer protein [Nanoarchaeota archaeon]